MASAQEIRVVAELLQISPEGLQKAITYKVTVSVETHHCVHILCPYALPFPDWIVNDNSARLIPLGLILTDSRPAPHTWLLQRLRIDPRVTGFVSTPGSLRQTQRRHVVHTCRAQEQHKTLPLYFSLSRRFTVVPVSRGGSI